MNNLSRLIVALDVGSIRQARELVNLLKPCVKIFKIGLQLFSLDAEKAVDLVKSQGGEVFLDLKFHDIPSTVSKAATAILHYEPLFFTLHTLGALKMLKETAVLVRETANKLKLRCPRMLGVTILTSMDKDSLKQVGIAQDLEKEVISLAGLAKEASLDGVVASPREIKLIRQKISKDFLIVTPGVRPAGSRTMDQKRTMTPKEAIQQGADFIVVGRPITQAKDPLKVTGTILKEIKS